MVALKGLSPAQLFVGAKLVELLYHLHPRRVWRMTTAADRRLRRHFGFAYSHIVGVFWDEIREFLRTTTTSNQA